MSDTETHYARLRKVDLKGKSIEQFCEEKVKELKGDDYEIPSFHDTYAECLRYEIDEKFFFNEDKTEIWEAIEHSELDNEDFVKTIHNADGTMTLITQFYNGGTCLSEIVEEELEKLK